MTKVLRYIRHFQQIQNQGVDRNFGSEHLTSYLAEGAAKCVGAVARDVDNPALTLEAVCSIDLAEYKMASATALPPGRREYGRAMILFPNVSAASFPLISVHSTLGRVQPSAANSIKATAMRPR